MRLFITIGVVLFALTAGAAGDKWKRDYSIQAIFSFDKSTIEIEDVSSETDTKGILGVYRLTKNYGRFEPYIALSHSSEKSDSNEGSDAEKISARVFGIGAFYNLKDNIPEESVVPYIFGGWVHLKFDAEPTVLEGSAFEVGVGTRVFVNPQLALMFQGSYLKDISIDGELTVGENKVELDDLKFTDITLSMGFSVYFGKNVFDGKK